MAITKIQSNAFPPTIDLSNIDITLGAGEVVTANIADLNVTTAKIADAAVHTDKIADNNVTHEKLHTDMDLSGKTVTLPTLNTPLTVLGNGNATLQWGDDTAIGALSFDINDNPLIRSYSGKDLFFQTNGGNNRMVIESGGNVGIGTDSPTKKLDIRGDFQALDGSSSVTFTEYNNGATLWLDGADGDLAGGDYYNISASNDGKLQFGYAGGTNLTLLSNGNFGIGHTTPLEKLHVNGNVYIGSGNAYIRGRSSSNWDYYLNWNYNNFRIYDSDNRVFLEAKYNSGSDTKTLEFFDGKLVISSDNSPPRGLIGTNSVYTVSKVYYALNSTDTSGSAWFRIAYMQARQPYRVHLHTTGGWYSPGYAAFTIMRTWTGAGTVVTDIVNMHNQYVNQVRSASSNQGGDFFLDVNFSGVNSNQLGGFLRTVIEPLGLSDNDYLNSVQVYNDPERNPSTLSYSATHDI